MKKMIEHLPVVLVLLVLLFGAWLAFTTYNACPARARAYRPRAHIGGASMLSLQLPLQGADCYRYFLEVN
jgi:hypothetical protein